MKSIQELYTLYVMKNLSDVYKIDQSYDWNYDHGPVFDQPIPSINRRHPKVKLWDFELHSTLGVPAGPLLNSNWVKFYAEMGFDIPVYKTVRTLERDAHPNPNCAYVAPSHQLGIMDIEQEIYTKNGEPEGLHDLTITNSFGVPSKTPKEWMADVERANSFMQNGQVMVVSINGTPGRDWSLEDDYARCASMAKEAGAKIIEANYSCPNVSTGEGSIYSDPEFSARISQKIRSAIGDTPFLIKMGMLPKEQLVTVVDANRAFVDGFSGINTIAMNVKKDNGAQALPGKGRLKSGLCGAGIHDAGLQFTMDLSAIRSQRGDDFVICGVGGMMTPEHLQKRLDAGADIVMSATAAMWDPFLAKRFHEREGTH